MSVDPVARLEEMRSSTGAEFDFLSDSEGELLDFFGVRHSEASIIDGRDIAQSASFLIDVHGRLIWSKVAENYRVRPRPEEILAVAESLPPLP